MESQGRLTCLIKCKEHFQSLVRLSLFSYSVNVFLGPEQEKIMMTGLHKVCDIHCKTCMKIVGWTYVRPRWNITELGVCVRVVREIQRRQVYCGESLR